MAEEIIYYSDLCYSERGIQYLSHFRLGIFAGETLDLICRREHEKKQLLLLLSGKEEFSTGEIYRHGKREERPFDYLRRNVSLIRSQSSIVGTLTVGENVFVLKPSGARRILFNSSVIHSQAQLVFDSFGVSLKADALADGLTAYDKYVLELIRAYTSRAELILVDSAAKSFTVNQKKCLETVYRRLNDSGISIVFLTVSPDDDICNCDRYALFNGGQISMIYPRSAFSVEAYHRSFPTDAAPPVCSYIKGAKELSLSITLDGKYFSFFRGERLGMLDSSGTVFQELYSKLTKRGGSAGDMPTLGGKPFIPNGLEHCYECGIVFANTIDVPNALIPNLSGLENIFLSSFKRLSTGIVLRRHLMQHASEKYREGLGESTASMPVGELADYLVQLKIYLERICMCRPKVLICMDPYEKSDDDSRRLWDDCFSKVSAEGASVIIVSSSASNLTDNCDRLISFNAASP